MGTWYEQQRERRLGRERARQGRLIRWHRRTLERTEEAVALVAVACEDCGALVPPDQARREGWSGEWFCRDQVACMGRQTAILDQVPTTTGEE